MAGALLAHYCWGAFGTAMGHGFRDAPSTQPIGYLVGTAAGLLICAVYTARGRPLPERISAARLNPWLTVVCAAVVFIAAFDRVGGFVGQRGEACWTNFLLVQSIPASTAFAVTEKRQIAAGSVSLIVVSAFLAYAAFQDWTDTVPGAVPRRDLELVIALGAAVNVIWFFLGRKVKTFPVRLLPTAVAYGLLLSIGRSY